MIEPKTEQEVLELQNKVRKAHENALMGIPRHYDLEAIVGSNGMLEFKTPILRATLYHKSDKPRPLGEKVIVRVAATEITSWEDFLACMLSVKKKDARKNVVYVLLMSNGAIKIGRTKHFNKRQKTISLSSGLEVTKYWHTQMVDIKKASRSENMAHKHFKEHRNKGEFFSVSYKDACNYVKELLSREEETNAETN